MKPEKRARTHCFCLSVFLLLFGLGVLTSCGEATDSGEPEASRGLRGIQPVSKSASQAAQRRVAIVIGNAAYEKSPLKNPVNDARAMARLLRRLDFEVELRENDGRREMLTALNNFEQLLRNADVGLFYYAGHGIQAKGRNYLIPVDAMLQTEADVEFEALDLGRVLGKMEDARCQLNIVVLDACRDNPFARSFRSAAKGLALVDAPRGTLLAFATSPGAVAADGTDGNGLYTKHLLANMERPDLSIEEVFKQVRIGVVGETSGRQTPWETSSLMGSFYFQPESGGAATLPATSERPVAAVTSAAPLSVAPAATVDSQPPAPAPLASESAPAPPSPTAALPPAVKTAVKTPALDPEIKKYLNMLQSGKAQDQRYAAKKIIRAYPTERILLDAVNLELLKGYQVKSRDKYHADAMAWFCNVLGASGESRYAATLRRVAESAPERKLKKYAAKNLRLLP